MELVFGGEGKRVELLVVVVSCGDERWNRILVTVVMRNGGEREGRSTEDGDEKWW